MTTTSTIDQNARDLQKVIDDTIRLFRQEHKAAATLVEVRAFFPSPPATAAAVPPRSASVPALSEDVAG